MKLYFVIGFLFFTTTFCFGKNIKTKYCYDKVEFFDNGLARVERLGKFGFINKKGEEVIECKYHWINYFDHASGLASFTDTLTHYGFINLKGETIVQPKYQELYSWDKNTGLAYVKRDNKYGFINNKGVEIIPCIYDQSNCTPENFFNGIAELKKNGKYGILDIKGKTLVEFEYDYFIGKEAFKDFPKDFLSAKKGNEYFYINIKTFEINKTNYDFAGEFINGMATVMKDNKYGYINSSFDLTVPCIYTNSRSFSEGLASVADTSGHWGYINKNGKLIAPFIYDITDEFSCGRAMVVKDSMVGFIDKTGKVVIPINFDYATFKSYYYERKDGFQDGICAVSKNKKYGIIDTTGTILLDIKYDEIGFATDYRLKLSDWFPIEENYALAEMNNEAFVINKNGKLVNSNSSTHLIYFVEDISYICDTSEKCGFMNSKGNLIIPFDYEYYEYSTFNNGYAVVKKNNKFGIINKKGDTILSANFDELSNFNDNLAKATKDGMTYFINRKGKTKLTVCSK
jgi:hypothetical protein